MLSDRTESAAAPPGSVDDLVSRTVTGSSFSFATPWAGVEEVSLSVGWYVKVDPDGLKSSPFSENDTWTVVGSPTLGARHRMTGWSSRAKLSAMTTRSPNLHQKYSWSSGTRPDSFRLTTVPPCVGPAAGVAWLTQSSPIAELNSGTVSAWS